MLFTAAVYIYYLGAVIWLIEYDLLRYLPTLKRTKTFYAPLYDPYIILRDKIIQLEAKVNFLKHMNEEIQRQKLKASGKNIPNHWNQTRINIHHSDSSLERIHQIQTKLVK